MTSVVWVGARAPKRVYARLARYWPAPTNSNGDPFDLNDVRR